MVSKKSQYWWINGEFLGNSERSILIHGLKLLLVQLLLLSPMGAWAKTYHYVVTVDEAFPKTRSFTINARERTCEQKTCTWKSSDSSPSVKGCKKIRDKVNRRILSYGHSNRTLNASEIGECNGTKGNYEYWVSFYNPNQSTHSINMDSKILTCKQGQMGCTWASNDGSPSVSGCQKVQKKMGRLVNAYENDKSKLSAAQIKKCNKTGKYKYVAKYEHNFGRNTSTVKGNIIRTCLDKSKECFWYSNDMTPSVEGCKNAKKFPQLGVGNIVSYGIDGTKAALDAEDIDRCNAKKVSLAFYETESYKRCLDGITGRREPRKNVDIQGHDFHCYEAKQRPDSSDREFTGKLSHALNLRPDDDFKYRILVENWLDPDQCKTFTEVFISRGGVAPVAGTIGRWAGKEDFEDAWRKAAKDWDSSDEWEAIGYRLINDATIYLGCK